MKKILFGMMAAATVLATSCAKELQNVAEGDATVTFAVGTPEIATRAYSDGTTATELQWAVYDADGNYLQDLTGSKEINISTTVELKLTTGNTYSVAFWADSQAAPYNVDFTTKSVSVDYAGVKSNDENLDAFYAWYTFTVTGAQTETVELKRPFAQLNIGTADYDASESAGYVPTISTVTVSNVYSTLNFATGAVDGATDMTFAENAIPAGEVFPVAGYEYLAMNYLLVAADKALVEVEFTYSDGSNAKTRTVGSVPVQRNYRTNIYGNILTSDVDLNVVIKPEYNEPDYELDDLHKAALNGGVVTLTEDVVLTSPLEVYGEMTINLNGKTISSNIHKSEGAVIRNNSTLTIIGGTVSSLGNNGGSAIANYGNLAVENAVINGAPREGDSWPSYPINNYGDMTLTNTTITGYQGCVALNAAGTTTLNNCELTKNYEKTSSHVFYVNHADAKVIVNGGTYNHNGFDGSLAYVNKGEVIINDGTFNAKDGGYGFAALTNGKVTINGGNINAGLLGWGGQFVVNGGIFASQPNASYLANGLKTVKQNNKWYVIANDTELVSSSAQFSDALSAGQNVLLASDVNIAKIDLTAVSNDVVIDANGNTITTASNYGIEVTAGKNVTLKNGVIEITVNGDYINYAAGFKIANGDYAGQTIKLENCEIRMANTDWAYAVTMPASVKNLNLVIDNCILEGAIALQCWGDNNTITVTNSELICNYTTSAMYTSYCVALQGDGTYNSENNTLAISNCEFSYSGVDNFNSEIRSVYAHGHTNTNTITVSDCDFVGVTAY